MSDERRTHMHRRGDEYAAVFGDFFGNPERGYTHEYTWLNRRRSTWSAAKRDGFDAQGSDDFNIGVIRRGDLIALLWMHEVVDDDPDVMAAVIASAGEP